MIQSHKSSFSADSRMLDLLNENFALLLFLQHFKVDFAVDTKTVGEICSAYEIDPDAFILKADHDGFVSEKSTRYAGKLHLPDDLLLSDSIRQAILLLHDNLPCNNEFVALQPYEPDVLLF